MPTWLGIDIGKSAVKVAAIRTSYRKTTMVGLGVVELAQSVSVEAAIREAVALATGGKATAADGAATALEGAKASTHLLSLPQTAQRQLAEIVPFELEAQVPFDMSESVYDHRVLSAARAPAGDAEAAGMLPVMTAVASIADVRERIALVKAAVGTEPERVGVGAFPLANLVPFNPALSEVGPVAVIDLGTRASDVLLLRSGEPIFTRTLSYGTEGLPQTAARLAREIRVTLAAYRASGGLSPTRIFLCGGGAFVAGAETFLANELEIKVEVLPAAQIEVEGQAADHVLQMPRFAKAIGLAVGLASGRPLGLDLRRGPLAYERGFGWLKEKIPLVAGIGAVIAVSFLFSTCAQLYTSGKEKATLEKALSTVTKDVLGEETEDPDHAQDLLSKFAASADEDPMPHADAFDVMVRISDAIPPSMVHDIEEFDLQKGHVTVHGIVGSIPDAQSIATTLRGESCFSDVKITRTNQVVGGERQKYVLEFDLKCPEDAKPGAKKPGTSAASSSSAAASAASSGGGK